MARFYSLDGTRIDEVPMTSKPGQFRAPTITDARKHKWLPSVTSILSTLSKQSLHEAKERLITEAAFCYQPQPGETPEDYHERILKQATGTWDEKRDKGSDFHEAIDLALNDQPFDSTWTEHVKAAQEMLIKEGITVEDTERTLVSPLGFAGTMDMRYSSGAKFGVLDWKTTTTKPKEKMKPWPTYQMQLSAYHMATWGEISDEQEGIIVMVSVNEPGRMEICRYGSEQLHWGWKAFSGLLDAWSFVNDYNPRQQPESL